MSYPDGATGEPVEAEEGDLTTLRCEGVVCPNPAVRDCYMDDSVCDEDEWCMLADEVREIETPPAANH